MALLSLFCCCLQAVSGLLTAVASLVEHGLWSSGLVVTVQGLSCPAACGIFLEQELKLGPLHWQADSFFFKKCFVLCSIAQSCRTLCGPVVHYFIYWVFAVFGLSLAAESEGYSLFLVHGLLTAVTSLIAVQGL